MLFSARRAKRPFFSGSDPISTRWSSSHLLLASFLTLFGELAFIRWIAVEVRVFAYFKNLALLLCFVGFGLGCSLAKKRVRWAASVTAFLGLILVVSIPWQQGAPLERLSQNLGGAGDLAIWAVATSWNWANFLSGALLAGALFLLMVYVFVPLGQVVSAQMNAAPGALRAYSSNLFGSLIGVVTFVAVSRWMFPPTIWLGVFLLGLALLQSNSRDRVFVASLLVPLALLLYAGAGAETQILWTPYQQIRFQPERLPNGDISGGLLLVNHTFYQRISNLSSQFLEQHPYVLTEPIQDNPYNIPFRFSLPAPKVLVVGAGTGNDVAAALRNGSSGVDAVEIDPAILELGKREHPEHPYDSPRVSIHVTDARSFLKRTPQHFDVILFGLLDSHAQFTDYANMRIDNFVYTEESFREAREHLTPNGVLVLKFWVVHPWLRTRLSGMLQRTFGKSPLVFLASSQYSTSATCFVVSTGNRVEAALAADPQLAGFVQQHAERIDDRPVPATTDDWPYLYQEGHWIPRTYYSVGLLVILIALGLYLQIGDVRRPPSLFFFSMGAGFLLLETQVISRLALFFGTIWQVNGIVISALLIALLIANWIVDRRETAPSRLWTWLALMAGLLLAYFFPFARIGSPTTGGVIAVFVFALPVLFAGILFSSEFKNVESPSAALGANMLGAVAGGLLENLSLLFGMHALLLVAIVVYAVVGLALRRRSGRRPASPPAATLPELSNT